MNILSVVRSGLNLVEELSGVATLLGGPAVVLAANIANGVATLAEHVLEKVDEGKIVMSSDDKSEISDILSKIAAENDKLAERIANS